MNRSITLHAGILGLSSFLASAASANVCYSTGPLENGGLANRSFAVFVSFLNNGLAGGRYRIGASFWVGR